MISPETARELLANQSERGALWNADWNFTDRTAAIVREDSPGDEVMEIRFNGDDTAFSDGDLTLAAAAPDLAQTIAGMTEEWGVERDRPGTAYIDGTVARWTTWVGDEARARKACVISTRGGNPRLVRRLVGPVEVTE